MKGYITKITTVVTLLLVVSFFGGCGASPKGSDPKSQSVESSGVQSSQSSSSIVSQQNSNQIISSSPSKSNSNSKTKIANNESTTITIGGYTTYHTPDIGGQPNLTDFVSDRLSYPGELSPILEEAGEGLGQPIIEYLYNSGYTIYLYANVSGTTQSIDYTNHVIKCYGQTQWPLYAAMLREIGAAWDGESHRYSNDPNFIKAMNDEKNAVITNCQFSAELGQYDTLQSLIAPLMTTPQGYYDECFELYFYGDEGDLKTFAPETFNFIWTSADRG